MNKADEYKKVALEILREYLESEETVIFEYSGNFEESAAELKETTMGYLERLGESEEIVVLYLLAFSLAKAQIERRE